MWDYIRPWVDATNIWLFLIFASVAIRLTQAVTERRDLSQLRKDMRINSLMLRCWALHWDRPSEETQRKLLELLEREDVPDGIID